MNSLRTLLCLSAIAVGGPVFAQIDADPVPADHSMDDALVDSIGDVIGGVAGDSAVSAADAATQHIDVLVVYTPAARAYAGSTNAMKAAINTYIAATNTAYANSDINVVLKLVGAAEVAYAETGSLSTDLQRLTYNDSYLSTVPALRDSYAADLVCLIRRSDAAGVAGIAWLGNGNSSFASLAYSVVADIWAVGNNSFPHELGHNFGCHHDHANGGGAVRAYAYGHRFSGTNGVQYRSIMAYSPGSRISYFSNPSISYQGTSTGVAGTDGTAADNARMIEEMSVVTGAFRASRGQLGSMIAADLNNDGKVDLLLAASLTSERLAWLMNGVTQTGNEVFGTVTADWRLAGAGDFSADRKTDLVWENTSTGERGIWLMDGATRRSIVLLPTVPVTWRIAAICDLNADGKPDLLLENTSTGERGVWYMNGTSRSSAAAFANVDTAWRIAAAGDFNGDRKPDLVWENTSTGERGIWYMNGTTRTSLAVLATVPVAWKIVGTGDFNADGKTDLVWENTSEKARGVWYMNGAARTAIASLPTPDAL